MRPAAGIIANVVGATMLVVTSMAPVMADERAVDTASYIVVTSGGATVEEPADALAAARDVSAARAASRLIRELGVRPAHRYQWALEGFAASLTAAQVGLVRADPSVRAIVPDRAFTGETSHIQTKELGPQIVPSGVRRTRTDESDVARIDGVDERIDVDVAIIDSGIADHPDLPVIAGGYDCTSPYEDAWRDRNGHGTHVAGIVGAIDDPSGVVGMAPGARLWAVKVLTDNDFGTLSSYLCGIDWVVAQRDPSDPSRPLIEVANMSLSSLLVDRDDRACGAPSGDVIHQAICASVADGTIYVAAAGNQGYDAEWRLPAAYEEVITVSALADFDGEPGGLAAQRDYCPWYSVDSDDTYANFSNSGVDIDVISPGKCILSTYLRKRLAWMSGTSMATPHVTGAVALYVSENPGVRPGQVRQALRNVASLDWATATDPDGDPDLLLRARAFDPPPVFRLQVAAPQGRLGRGGLLDVPVTVDRLNGHDAPVAISVVDLPVGVTASMRERAPGMPEIVLRAASDAAAGAFELTVRATDGELIRNEPLPIVITGGALTAFTSPVAGPPDVISPDADVTVAWDESGSPAPDARTIQRQHAMPTEAGTCAGLAWAADGPARPVSEVDPGGTPGSGWSFTESAFAADGCYRWVVALTDAAGREGRWNSGTVIVDSTAPPPPDVVATGDGVWQGDVNEVVWVRQGSGTLRLAGTGTDASGGVASTRFGPLDVPGGWAHDPGAVLGDPSAVDIGWDASASDTTLGVMSTDVQGLEGAARTVSLRVDGTPPSKPSWSSPPSGTSYEYESIELLWGGAPDVGSGLASEQLVQRQRGPVVTKGSCAGVSYQDDGPPRLVGRHQEETGLSSNKCYRWKLTARDRVGNVGGITTSGAVLFDGIAPVGAFEFPPSGTHASRTKTSLLIRWTQGDTGGSGGLLRAVERERTKRIAPDDCDGLRWKLDGPTITDPSPIRSSGLKSGYCYRWRLVLTDRAASVTTVISGTIAVMPPAALSVRRAL